MPDSPCGFCRGQGCISRDKAVTGLPELTAGLRRDRDQLEGPRTWRGWGAPGGAPVRRRTGARHVLEVVKFSDARTQWFTEGALRVFFRHVSEFSVAVFQRMMRFSLPERLADRGGPNIALSLWNVPSRLATMGVKIMASKRVLLTHPSSYVAKRTFPINEQS